MPRRLLRELERRNVLKVALGYMIAAWLIAQVADLVLESFAAPDWAMRALLISLGVGFPIALGISWTFEVTSRGIVPETEVDRTVKLSDQSGRRVDGILLLIVAVVIVFMGLERFIFSSREAPATEAPAAANGTESAPTTAPTAAPAPPRSVAVLPLAVLSTGPDDDYFAAGLTEEIINALSQSPELMVTARTSSFHFRDRNLPVGQIAGQLGVAHVVEGSVRRAGDRLRVTAQLVRAADGFQLWSETYDTRTEETFEVQADIAARVAQALNVLMDENLRERMKRSGTRNVEAFIALQKGIEYYQHAHTEANRISLLRQANQHFEDAIAREPQLVEAYEYHADLYQHVLMSQAAGELDAEIVEADVTQAPGRLEQDYERAIRHARTPQQRANAEFGRALALGEWRGLSLLAQGAATTPGCEIAGWLHLVTPLMAQPATALEAYGRMATCDPLRYRPHVHTAGSLLWMGAAERALESARNSLRAVEHPALSRYVALALALLGRPGEAEEAAIARIRAEDELLSTRAQLAAIRGDAAAAREFQARFLGQHGPNDRDSLVLAAARGDRFEANRLAAAIDSRPFGHLVLLEAVHACLCGAPFDIEAVPVFAAQLADSGFAWPPARPYPLPLKSW